MFSASIVYPSGIIICKYQLENIVIKIMCTFSHAYLEILNKTFIRPFGNSEKDLSKTLVRKN